MADLRILINQSYQSLSNREAQVADLLLQDPNQILWYSASELANEADVSNSTVTRLVQVLGFKSYDELRKAVRSTLTNGSPLHILHNVEHAPSSDTDDPLRQFMAQEKDILDASYASLSGIDLDAIATRLVEARNLGFLGFRNSQYFAAYARWQFVQFRPRTRQMPGAGETIAERIADLGPDDVVLVIAIRRIVGKLPRYIDAIKKTGADVLLITDPSSSALGKNATWTIVCPVENPEVFDSYVGVLSIIRFLAYRSFRKSAGAGQNYMEAIERQHDQLDEFD